MGLKIYVLRHGSTELNGRGAIRGWLDVPLNEEGRAQARLAAAHLADVPFARAYTSDLVRAVETASIVAGGHPRSLNALGGIDPGSPEELKRAEHSDLVTFPANVPGAVCGNCQFYADFNCRHPDVVQAVSPERNCCSLWDAPGTRRPWLPGAAASPRVPFEIVHTPALRPINFGDLQGRDPAKVREQVDGLFAAWSKDLSVRAPNGGSFAEMQDRLYPFLVSVAESHPDGNVLLVTHMRVCCYVAAFAFNQGRPLSPADTRLLEGSEVATGNCLVLSVGEKLQVVGLNSGPNRRGEGNVS